MKKQFITSSLFLTLIFIIGISTTTAYFFVSRQSEESVFKTHEWVPAETNVTLLRDEIEYSVFENVFSYIDNTEDNQEVFFENPQEKYLLSYDKNSPQFLSFKYKLIISETAQLFDSPNVLVLANNILIGQIDQNSQNNNWQQLYIDLSKTYLESGEYEITFVLQNTFDEKYLSELEIKEVTTTQLFMNEEDGLVFETNKEVSEVLVEYKTIENEQIVDRKLGLSFPYELKIKDDILQNELWYYSKDLFDNYEEKNSLSLTKNEKNSNIIFQPKVFYEGKNEISLQVEYNNNATTLIKPVIKISENQITSQGEWEQATNLPITDHKQFYSQNSFIKREIGIISENLLLKDVPFGNYYLAVRLCDQSENCSEISENESITIQ